MYKRLKHSWWKHMDFILVDLIGFQLAYLLAYFVRNGFGRFPYQDIVYDGVEIIILLVGIVVAFFADVYKGIIRRDAGDEVIATIKYVIEVVVALLVALFIAKKIEDFSRSVFIWFAVFSVVLIFGFRIALKHFLRWRWRHSGKLNSLLVITTQKQLQPVITQLKRYAFGDYRICGLCVWGADPELDTQKEYGYPLLATDLSICEKVKTVVVDEVFIHMPKNEVEAYELIHMFSDMGITTHMNAVNDNFPIGCKNVADEFAEFKTITTSLNEATPRQLIIKRVMDIIGGLVGCLICGIMWLFVAPIIKKQSPGPVFFSQMRVGENGRIFKIYKFRSMYMDAEERKKELMKKNEMKGLMFKMKDDPRIFPFGHFLRDKSIDEFPQFYNVLKGDMSLVGTRPPTLDEWEQYEMHHRRRMAMKPGLTGMWQVSGRSDIKDFEEVVKMDTEYIQNWSVGLDIRILLKTVKTVLRGDGAV